MTDLKASIQQYEIQLKQVVEALKHAKDNAEAESLRSLKSDLEELVELTRQTLQQDPDGTESGSSASNSNGYDDEMALFMSEIKSLEATGPAASSTALNNCDTNEKLDMKLRVIKDELQAMVGKKCSAPHDHAWGARTYHNAIICSMDDTRDYELADIKEFRVRILFTNPTHKEMIPCGFFLDGNCKFDVEKCRFSHGELVPVGELKDYKEPEFHKLKRNCIVLAKMYDKLWHKGRVLCVNVVEKSCQVRLEQQRKDVDFNFEDLFPIFHDDDQSSGSSDSEDDADIADLRNAYLIEKSLLTPAADQALGEWEKHTRGIGSKLMQKMGYIVGTGLGSTGAGIITPISAQILPPGRSLDHCMELRESANGDKNLFSVERKMKIAKKKQDAFNTKLYERAKNKTDIFSFLNDNILATSSTKPDSTADKAPLMRNEYKNHTLKNLNVESLKIGDDIRRKEREIQKLQESMRRHTAGSDIHKKMQGQMAIKSNELSCLRKSESNVTREQTLRKHKDKLSVF